MKDVYAVLLLHSAGQKVTEENLGKVLTAAGASEEATKLKAVVAALEGVNIDEAVKQAALRQSQRQAPVARLRRAKPRRKKRRTRRAKPRRKPKPLKGSRRCSVEFEGERFCWPSGVIRKARPSAALSQRSARAKPAQAFFSFVRVPAVTPWA